MQECAQILGIDSMQIMGMVNDPQMTEQNNTLITQRINSWSS